MKKKQRKNAEVERGWKMIKGRAEGTKGGKGMKTEGREGNEEKKGKLNP